MKGSFEQVHVQVYMHLQPSWVKKINEGVNNVLGKKLLKYSDEFEGVPVAFNDVKLLDRVGIIKDESPYFHFLVRYSALYKQLLLFLVRVSLSFLRKWATSSRRL